MLVAGLTHHLKGKMMENMTVPEAYLLAAGGLEEGVHFPCIDLPPGAVLFIEGGAWREVHSFPARITYTLHLAHMVHAWLAEKKKNWGLQMDLVSAKISTPKDSGRKNALNP